MGRLCRTRQPMLQLPQPDSSLRGPPRGGACPRNFLTDVTCARAYAPPARARHVGRRRRRRAAVPPALLGAQRPGARRCDAALPLRPHARTARYELLPQAQHAALPRPARHRAQHGELKESKVEVMRQSLRRVRWRRGVGTRYGCLTEPYDSTVCGTRSRTRRACSCRVSATTEFRSLAVAALRGLRHLYGRTHLPPSATSRPIMLNLHVNLVVTGRLQR